MRYENGWSLESLERLARELLEKSPRMPYFVLDLTLEMLHKIPAVLRDSIFIVCLEHPIDNIGIVSIGPYSRLGYILG